MHCNEWINQIIYKHKVVIFGLRDDDYTRKSKELFKQRFSHEAEVVLLDENQMAKCFTNETVPQIYLNGMKLGGFYRTENLCYSDNLSLFF